jgi:hypothetical protein
MFSKTIKDLGAHESSEEDASSSGPQQPADHDFGMATSINIHAIKAH